MKNMAEESWPDVDPTPLGKLLTDQPKIYSYLLTVCHEIKFSSTHCNR